MQIFSRSLVFFTFVMCSFYSFSQTLDCGTVIDETNVDQLRQINQYWQNNKDGINRSVTAMNFVPVQLHIIRTSAGTGGISPAEYIAALDRVNEMYHESKIHFYQCAAINYIDDDNYYNYDYSEMAALDAAHSVANVINIYSSENVTSGASNICGHAQFPGGLDFVMLANSCTKNGSTFAHELGHYVGLYHTHEPFFGAELVNGTNCGVAGDLLCDTPADPSLSGNINTSGCIYTGVGTDGNGQAYVPDVENVMSYTSKECRTIFSDDQRDRALLILQTSRAYLTCGAVALAADFIAGPDATCNNSLTVQFADISEGSPTGWSWNFGDGVGTSTAQFPSYTYNAPGIYDVSLTISKSASSDAITKTQLIKVGMVSIPFTQDFESGSSSLGDFHQTNMMKNGIAASAIAANTGSYGLMMEGYNISESPYFITPSSATAFESLWNPYYKSKVELCIDATTVSDLTLDFDLKQLYGFNVNYTNLRILANGTQVAIYQPDGTETWEAKSINLNAYAGTTFTLAFEGSHKYTHDFQTTDGSGSLIDNISITGSPTLPVEYSHFTAVQKGISVQLDWGTNLEVNNDHYEVMKSLDNETWEKLGEVKSDPAYIYAFSDEKALSAPVSALYYQLKQVDLNGNFALSEVKTIHLKDLAQISVFPNPVTDDQVQVILSNATTKPVQISVIDELGRLIYQSSQLASETQPLRQFDVPLTEFPKGSYFLKIVTSDSKTIQKLIRL